MRILIFVNNKKTADVKIYGILFFFIFSRDFFLKILFREMQKLVSASQFYVKKVLNINGEIAETRNFPKVCGLFSDLVNKKRVEKGSKFMGTAFLTRIF